MFYPLRIISEIESAANSVFFVFFIKTVKIESNWVGVLVKMSVLDTVFDDTGGNRF